MHFTDIHMIKTNAGTKEAFCFIIVPPQLGALPQLMFWIVVSNSPLSQLSVSYLQFHLFANRGLHYRNCLYPAFEVLVEVSVEFTVSRSHAMDAD
jgi:hypothetical protein